MTRSLRDLARVNALDLRRAADARLPSRAPRAGMPAFRLLDVGFGQGDMLRAIARWARRRGIAVDLIGVDLNPSSEAAARAVTPASTADRLSHRRLCATVPGPFDFVISSLVAHHMTDDRAARLPSLHGEARDRTRLADQRSPPPQLRLSRLSAARPPDRRAPDRSRGRAALDRAVLPPRRMAGDPRRRRRPRGRGADRPPLPLPAYASNGCADRRRRAGRVAPRRSRWRAAARCRC